MDGSTQPSSPDHDEITASPAAPTFTSFIGPSPSPRGSAHGPLSRPNALARTSSIRIRRLPSTPLVPQINVEDADTGGAGGNGDQVGRQRSSSAPQPGLLSTTLSDLARQRTGGSHMPSVREDASELVPASHVASKQSATMPDRMRRASTSARSFLRLERGDSASRPTPTPNSSVHEYEPGVVDLLDVVGECKVVSDSRFDKKPKIKQTPRFQPFQR